MGSLRRFLGSFAHAARGCGLGLQTQRNLRVHMLAVAVVVALGLWHRVERWEWCALLLACGLVVAAELGNTAVEWLADRVTRDREPAIRDVKDAAAGAVLAASLVAAAVGALVFGPRWL
ncbi:MAG: diacylglycerol kinase family protein [Planctomycetes bacterium]|nr:diacylglycerol kinase family protein [Planctomycetota bacterium]